MKALIGMSGGVDSSVAALLIRQAGLEAVGCIMKLSPFSSPVDATDAARVAESLGMPFYALDLSADFSSVVIADFVAAYERGETPNPCIVCNRYMKFGKLLEAGAAYGCDTIATGHYARLDRLGDRVALRKAVDETKDQSYVLSVLSQRQLAHALFPLGGYRKSEIREIAAANGFVTAGKSESQDICFIPDGDYAAFLSRYTGKTYPVGNFVDKNGNILGKHKGTVSYTLGQRKGLGVAAGHPVFVTDIDPEQNLVTLGENEDLFTTQCRLTDVNYVSVEPQAAPFRTLAKVRYRQKEMPATATPQEDGTLRLTFDLPVRAITPGQTAVLYDGDLVLCSGKILRTPRIL